MSSRKRYSPTKPETIRRLIEVYNQAAQVARTGGPAPNWQLLSDALPHGSLTRITFANAKPGLVALTIRDRNPRYLEPEAAAIVLALALFNPSAVIIDSDRKGGDERHYVEIGDSKLRRTLLRILADPGVGYAVEQQGDHHDLSASTLAIKPDARKKSYSGRREAVEAALKAYDLTAAKWGLDAILSRACYRALLRGCFRLYDVRHGHHYLTPIPAA